VQYFKRGGYVVIGTVPFYMDCFMTNIMNRLVECETMTLSAQYEVYKQEIDVLHEASDVKEDYLRNLNDAYNRIKLAIKGEDISLLNG